MAISFIRASTIQRAKGHSVSAALAYETGQSLERLDGESVDYRNRGGVENEAHIFGTTMGLQELADKMELAENRRNSCVGRRFIMALPHELSQEGRAKVGKEFTEHLYQKYGVAGVLTIHEPDKRGSEKNHHAHLTFSDRKINEDGISFGAKVRELSDKRSRANLQGLKERWAEICNEQLQVEKIEEKLDPTPYAQNGKIAQLHEGKRRTEISRKIEKGHSYQIPKARENDLLEKMRERIVEPIKKVLEDEELRKELLTKSLERLKLLKDEWENGLNNIKEFVQSFDSSSLFKKTLERLESSRLSGLLSEYKRYESELRNMYSKAKDKTLSDLKEDFENYFKKLTGKGVEESIEEAESITRKEYDELRENLEQEIEQENGHHREETKAVTRGTREIGYENSSAGTRVRDLTQGQENSGREIEEGRKSEPEDGRREREFAEAFDRIGSRVQKLRGAVPESLREQVREEKETARLVAEFENGNEQSQVELLYLLEKRFNKVRREYLGCEYKETVKAVSKIVREVGTGISSGLNERIGYFIVDAKSAMSLAQEVIPKTQSQQLEQSQRQSRGYRL